MSGQLVVVAPEAARWLGVEVPASATVVVGRVAGGVGTSTVARLLGDVLVGLRGALVSPQVVDAGAASATSWYLTGDEQMAAAQQAGAAEIAGTGTWVPELPEGMG